MSRVTGYFNVLRTVLISILLNGVLLPLHTPAKANELSALGLPQTWQKDWQTFNAQVTAGEIAVSEQGIPAALDAATHKLSDRGVYQVDIRTEQADIPFNQIHPWIVRVTTPSGQPVVGATIRFFGGMPLHNHGFPTEPQVSGEHVAGEYRLDGIKFDMYGWWQLLFAITANNATDTVTFNVAIQP